MNRSSSLLFLLLVFSALYVVEPRHVKTKSRQVIDLNYPGCGRRSIQNKGNNRKEGFLSPPAELNHTGGHGSIQHVIIGGATSMPHAWPWMVAILMKGEDGQIGLICGGSLISRKYVLSAAHCFFNSTKDIDISKYHTVLGAHTIGDGTEYPIQNIVIHPDFNISTYLNDISVITLAKDVSLNDKIVPVCLPSASILPKVDSHDKNVTVTGWGQTSFNSSASKVLLEASILVTSREECGSYIPIYDTEENGGTYYQFCAFVKEGGKDTCAGDSGGPLVMEMTDHAWVQLGITSYGYPNCGDPDNPAVYTNVTTYIKWIYDNTDLGKSDANALFVDVFQINIAEVKIELG